MDIIDKLNESNKITKIIFSLTEDELENVIKIAADAYYNTEKSLISDEIFDLLVDRLKQINPQNPVLTKTGAPVKGKKVKLPFWMGSMNKYKEEKQLESWEKKYTGPYVISDKLDGISCLVYITKDNKISLFTRGNGQLGQDISHLLDFIQINLGNIPKNKYPTIAVRGELIMSKENFEPFAKKIPNARNMVAGIVNTKPENLNEEQAALVEFIPYELITPTGKKSKQLKTMESWKFNVVNYKIVNEISIDFLDKFLKRRKNKSLYEIDGIIIDDDNLHDRNTSGNPDYGFAYKGSTPTEDTTVTDITWNASKDGVLVPTIHFESIFLSGATLSKTTGFCAKYVVENNIGPGAVIKMVRSGEVIPYILEIVKPAKKPALPDPKKGKYEWDKNEVNIVLIDKDNNDQVKIKRLTKFMKVLGVENISEGIVKRFVENGFDTIFKIVVLEKSDLLSMEGFQDKLATKLIDNLKTKLEKVNILKLMVASNIFAHGFGERKLKKILDEYPDIISLYKESNRSIWEKKLIAIDGLNIITVKQFLDPLPEFIKFHNDISNIINVKSHKKPVVSEFGLMRGEVVVFTGFRNEEWKNWIIEQGGRVAGSVSGKTTLLVHEDSESGTVKLNTAKEKGIKIMSKTEFGNKYNLMNKGNEVNTREEFYNKFNRRR
jgi:NAD-dependent DNA ligase